MHRRIVVGLVLAILTVIVLVPALIDPIEGSLPLAVGGILLLVTWAVSRVRVPRLAWIGWLVAVVSGITAVVAAVQVRLAQDVPVGGAEGLPAWIWVLFGIYEVSVVVTIVGAVIYVVRHVRARRSLRAVDEVSATPGAADSPPESAASG